MANLKPRIEKSAAFMVAGLRKHHAFGDAMFGAIASQWEEFGPMIPRVANPKGRASFGLCFDMVGNRPGFDYLTGVEVTSLDSVKQPFAGATVPAKTYAVFSHQGHVSRLSETVQAAWDWLPTSGRKLNDAGGPTFFERYGEAFDPRTGEGDIEVWFPVTA
jgi:AraC family transcriptional regulator